ncbi:SusC/RagA family TonB-linked outer membrane protein, partial [Marinilabilia sp.]
MKKVLLALSFLMVFGLGSIFAQAQTVTGTVTGSEDGMPIPGVSVFVKGTTVGTVTQPDGTYSLNVPENAEAVVFSFVGMQTQEVIYEGQSTIDVALVSEAIAMDEVVVVAYGTATKESFTGTAAKVDAEKIESKNVSNISQALSGEVAGVQVINSNGQPGSTADIRIRGIGSINGSRDPLYVVDGIPLQGDINSIAPSDIESTTILKDAAATAIYGSRGANGVVIITTKQGKRGDSRIEVDLKHGVNFRLLPDYDVFTSPENYVETAWSALKTKGMLNGAEDPVAYANTYLFNGDRGAPGFDPYYNMWDTEGAGLINPSSGKFNSGVSRRYSPETWRDELFQNANRTEASVRLSGGNDKSRYFTSFSWLDDQGYYINSDYERFTGRVNIEHEVKPWLKGTMNMNFMKATSNFAGGQDEDSNNGFWFVSNMPPLYPVYARDAEGNPVSDPIFDGEYIYDYGDGGYGTRRFGSLTNAVASSVHDVVRDDDKQFSGTSKLEASFLKDFKLSSTFGAEYFTRDFDNLGNAFYGGSANQGGSIYKVKYNYFAYTTTNMLRYSKKINSHNISAFIAQEASFYEMKRLAAFKSNLADPFSLELNNAVVSSPTGSYKVEEMLSSYFGQLSYDFDEKYFFQGVLRRDGSSKFRKEKWGTFGSVSGAWMVSKEPFMNSLSNIFSELKIKSSFGINGEQGGIGAYAAHDLYSVNNLNDEVAIVFDNKGNEDLTWESSEQFQVGTEFELFKRVAGSVDYYSKNTTNLLFDKRISPSKGYAIIQVNDGKMVNSGIEFDLNAQLYKSNDLNIDFGINGAFEKNEITAMPIEDATGEQKVLDASGIYGRSVGHSLFDIYIPEYVGVDPNTGAAQWNRYYNELADGSKEYIKDMQLYLADNSDRIGTIGKEATTDYSLATDKYIGKSPIPTVRGAFDLSVEYKGFALKALFNYSLGGYGYDGNYAALMEDDLVGSNNWHKDITNAWKEPGDITDVPAITGGTNTGDINYSQANRTSDR